MRDDKDALLDIVDFLADVAKMVNNSSQERFLEDDILRSAIQYKLLVTGEAVTHLSKELREKHPELPWRTVAAYRNFSIHAYHAVNWNQVWNTATVDAPAFHAQVRTIISSEFPS